MVLKPALDFSAALLAAATQPGWQDTSQESNSPTGPG